MKPMPASRKQCATSSGVEADLDAERGEHIAGAGLRRGGAVAVFGDRHAAGRDDQAPRASRHYRSRGRRRRCRRYRSRRAAPRPAASSPRMAVTAPVISSTVSPRTRRRHQKGAHLRTASLRRDIIARRRRPLRRASAPRRSRICAMRALKCRPWPSLPLARAQSFRRALRRGVAAAGRRSSPRAISRKFFRIRWPCSEAMLSG